MLRTLYRKLPLPHEWRAWFSKKIPDHLKREKHLKNFGVINDLYFWRTDLGIETLAPIQNFYSALFPHLETKTEGHIWIWDNEGNLINDHSFNLPHMGYHELNINQFVQPNCFGTFMWHISVPDSIAKLPEVLKEKIYFTDRGYICFLKNGVQPSFIHGIDRYATFQKQSKTEFEKFYKHDSDKTWVAEFPLTSTSENKIDIILINRSDSKKKFTLNVFRNESIKLLSKETVAPTRGVVIFTLSSEELALLDKNSGYFTISGIPTPWGRPAIMRHFENGAISAMHC